MKLDKVTDKVWANWDGETGGNVGVIELDDKTLAVDSQYPGSARKFREAIPRVSDKPLSHLLLTHVHGDHVFGSQHFKDLVIVSHLRLLEKMRQSLRNEWAPGNLEKMLEGYREDSPERWWLFEGLEIVLPSVTFDDKWEIESAEFIHTGGHTDCSGIVYEKDTKTLFSGDLLFVGRFPWAGDPTANPDEWIEAFHMILDMPVESIIPGHGPLCDKQEVKKQLKWFQEIRWIMKGMIDEGASVEDVVNYDYPPLYESDRPEWVKRSYRHWYQHWSKTV